MDLAEIAVRLDERLKEQLPGQEAHQVMRASPVGSNVPKFDHRLPPRPGSVLILLYQDADGRIKFPLIKRPDYLGTHSGQVSFPGGKAEPGENYHQTALRETEEEIGVRAEGLRVIGRLSDFFVIPSNFMVTPVIAYSERQPVFVADTIEVVRILKGDLFYLLPDEAIKMKEITVARQFRMMAPHFEIEGEVVWGATAMILNEFRVILRELI